jgi:MYXO-CTERM domain-containing protein
MHRLVLPLAAATLATSAHAGLMGTSATLRYQYGAQTTFDSVVVGAGTEVSCPGTARVCSILTAGWQGVDFGDLWIGYRYAGPDAGFNDVTPNRFVFTDLSPGFAIGGVWLGTDIAGLDASRVSFDSTSVTVDMHGLPLGPGESSFIVSLTPVPEPPPALLALAGLALVAFRRSHALNFLWRNRIGG